MHDMEIRIKKRHNVPKVKKYECVNCNKEF